MYGYCLLKVCCLLFFIRRGWSESSTEGCFCELSGKPEECCCDVETVDQINKEIYPVVSELVKKNFFRFFRVNLNKPCPFWPDDGACAIKDCSVAACKEEELPEGIKSGQGHQQANGSVNRKDNNHKKRSNDEQNTEETCEPTDNQTLGEIDSTISDEDKHAFEAWQAHDDAEDNFCELDDESSSGMEYVDLLRNPEKFTGYAGFSAQRIWNNIYKENCFKPTSPYGKSYGVVTSKNVGEMCLEKRVFYRMMSGLHASINIHLSALYLFNGIGLMKPRWGINLEEFKRRFDPMTTNGEGPTWLKNLYFAYTVVLRAITKAAPFWEQEQFYTGGYDDDTEVHQLVQVLLAKSKTCPSTFDEKLMFKDPASAKRLKEEFKLHFRNVSRIMDCVGCDKCRLWGKVQVQGLGTALKILFSGGEFDEGKFEKSSQFQLSRIEIVSLFNAFGRLSSSVNYLQQFRSMEHGHR
ncbi:ERO1-like protein beta isoform X1 [Montipora capricornis]|uniref:ERO1-like protein beta isoform X1 n=1 Tax=Montipora capricornis TaxID=246305 RepID=UPI0035F121E0